LALRAAAFAIAAAAAAGPVAATELKPWKGGETPALAGAGVDGKAIDLKAYRGRVVLVNFWATWCEPCRDEMPSFDKLRARLSGRPFELITVNFGEGAPKIEGFLRKLGITLPVLLDPEKKTAAAWGAGGLPMTFLVDAGGRVRYSAFGEEDWNAGEPLRVIETLLAEAPRAR